MVFGRYDSPWSGVASERRRLSRPRMSEPLIPTHEELAWEQMGRPPTNLSYTRIGLYLMEWERTDKRIPIKSWCKAVESGALEQAENLAELNVTYKHVALMPDCHVGYGMPIGGVIACIDAVIPNAVGVDIGCGMLAVETGCPAEIGRAHV